LVLTYSKRVVDGENTAIRISMNGLLRAIRHVGATEGNRYSAMCMTVHSECVVYTTKLGGTADYFQSVPYFLWDGFFIFKEEQL
jgi:hypothetical protein